MEPFRDFTGLAAPFLRNDVDTDLIIPKQFLTSVSKTGYGLFLFNDLRYRNPAKDSTVTADQLEQEPGFVLNQPRYRDAQILLAGNNFGCGSSREHAVWALAGFGFKAIIAQSFADIFSGNSSKNGLLLISQPQEAISEMAALCESPEGCAITVSLSAEEPHLLCAGKRYPFAIDAGIKERLLEGLDDIALTERLVGKIKRYEEERRAAEPWLDISGPESRGAGGS